MPHVQHDFESYWVRMMGQLKMTIAFPSLRSYPPACLLPMCNRYLISSSNLKLGSKLTLAVFCMLTEFLPSEL